SLKSRAGDQRIAHSSPGVGARRVHLHRYLELGQRVVDSALRAPTVAALIVRNRGPQPSQVVVQHGVVLDVDGAAAIAFAERDSGGRIPAVTPIVGGQR